MPKSRTKSKLPLILIVLGLILAAAFIVVPRFFSPSSAPKSSPPDASGLQTYSNKRFGFSFQHPTDWSVTDTYADNQQIIITHNSNNALVKINAYKDTGINSKATVEQASQRFIQEMQSDPNITVKKSETSFNDQSQTGGHLITGQQLIDSIPYEFQNRSLISVKGRLLFFHGAIKQEFATQEYADAINTIINSFSVN